MSFKQKVYAQCLHVLNEKIASLKKAIQELEAGAENDNKSSAGDKHETARAMMQIEQEKLSKQLNESLLQLSDLKKINPANTSAQIIKGSLVGSNKGMLFISIALGKIEVDARSVVVLSPKSPLGIKLMGLKANDTTEVNGTKYIIEEIN